MNREELFDAITGIREKYIQEADPSCPQKKSARHWLRPGLSAAAILLLVIGLAAAAMRYLPMFQSADNTSAETMAAAAGEKEAGNAAADEEEAAAQDAASGELEEAQEETEEETAAAAQPEAAIEEAPKDLTEELSLFWAGREYVPQLSVLETAVPEGYVEAGTLSSEPEAEFYLADESLSGSLVWKNPAEPEVLYVSYSAGCQRYVLQE